MATPTNGQPSSPRPVIDGSVITAAAVTETVITAAAITETNAHCTGPDEQKETRLAQFIQCNPTLHNKTLIHSSHAALKHRHLYISRQFFFFKEEEKNT